VRALERKEGTKYSLLVRYVCTMKSCHAEHLSRNGVFEFHLFRSSIQGLFDNLVRYLGGSFYLARKSTVQYTKSSCSKFLNDETLRLKLGSTLVEGNLHIVVMQILARLFYIRETQV
jgi:hypothetical protein